MSLFTKPLPGSVVSAEMRERVQQASDVNVMCSLGPFPKAGNGTRRLDKMVTQGQADHRKCLPHNHQARHRGARTKGEHSRHNRARSAHQR